jgi:hypothetical protein
MADLRPLGSERLEGIDKLKRIMEIARYNEAPKNEINENSTLDYTITLADGHTYGIVRERLGYIIKKGLNESTLDYSDSIRHRKYHRSYSEAMKKLNLVAGELNRLYENTEGISLIGEQPESKKKFILKQNKPKSDLGSVSAPDMGGMTPPPPAPDMGATPPPPAPDMAGMPPPPPAPDMGATPPPPAPDMAGMPPSDDSASFDPTGGEEPMPGMGDDPMMGSDEEPMPGMGDDPMMGSDEEPMPGMGDEDASEDEETGGTATLKTIQKLTGRLSQKIRTFDKEKGLDSQDIKYVLNSVISAIDLSKLDDEDRDNILDKLEEYDEYDEGSEGDLNLGDENGVDIPMDDLSSEDGEDPMPGMGGDEMPLPDSELKTESKVERVLSKYFDIKLSEKPLLQEKRTVNFLKQKLQKINVKKEIESMCETLEQRISANIVLKENENAKFIGKTNKDNLIFSVNKKQIKVTPRGIII